MGIMAAIDLRVTFTTIFMFYSLFLEYFIVNLGEEGPFYCQSGDELPFYRRFEMLHVGWSITLWSKLYLEGWSFRSIHFIGVA